MYQNRLHKNGQEGRCDGVSMIVARSAVLSTPLQFIRRRDWRNLVKAKAGRKVQTCKEFFSGGVPTKNRKSENHVTGKTFLPPDFGYLQPVRAGTSSDREIFSG